MVGTPSYGTPAVCIILIMRGDNYYGHFKKLMNNLPEPQIFSSLCSSLKLNVTEPLSVTFTVPILVISIVRFSKGERRVKVKIKFNS